MELSGDAGGAERVGIGLVGFTGDWLVDTAIALRPAAIVSHRLLNMHLDLLLHSLVAAFRPTRICAGTWLQLRSHMPSTDCTLTIGPQGPQNHCVCWKGLEPQQSPIKDDKG